MFQVNFGNKHHLPKRRWLMGYNNLGCGEEKDGIIVCGGGWGEDKDTINIYNMRTHLSNLDINETPLLHRSFIGCVNYRLFNSSPTPNQRILVRRDYTRNSPFSIDKSFCQYILKRSNIPYKKSYNINKLMYLIRTKGLEEEQKIWKNNFKQVLKVIKKHSDKIKLNELTDWSITGTKVIHICYHNDKYRLKNKPLKPSIWETYSP
jgi:hypothetical protein